MENSEEIRKLEEQKKDIQDQIDDIQRSCKHPNLKANFIQDDNGSNKRVMMVCVDCKAPVRYPTPSELDDFCS